MIDIDMPRKCGVNDIETLLRLSSPLSHSTSSNTG